MLILVVDDSAVLRHLIRKELQPLDAEFVESCNGEDAIQKAISIRPDLITLDVDMEGLNGYETCRRLREAEKSQAIDPPTPIIFITANDTIEDRERGLNAGAMDFVAKPFASGEVLSIARRILTPNRSLEGLKVVVADDCPIMRNVLVTFLKSQGLTVYPAADGREALELVREYRHDLDLLVTDCVMPEMDGEALCKALRTELAILQLPVIFLSGVAEREYMLRMYKAGASDFVVKPFIKEELYARIRVHLEMRMLTKSLLRNNTELKRLNQLKSQFLAVSSHDLRAPLTGIMGIPNLLVQESYIKPEHKELLRLMEESGKFLLDLINDILALSESQSQNASLKADPVPLDMLLRGAQQTFSHMAAPKRIGLRVVNTFQGSPVMHGDVNALRRVVNNLYSNAVKFTRPGGSVLGILEPDGQNGVNLIVRDTGIGIEPEKIKAIFDPYSKVRRVGTSGEKTTGLGMAITYELIRRLGGSISVQSQPGVGTEFKVNFPIVQVRELLNDDPVTPAPVESIDLPQAEFNIGSPSA